MKFNKLLSHEIYCRNGYAEAVSDRLCSQYKFRPSDKYVPMMPLSMNKWIWKLGEKGSLRSRKEKGLMANMRHTTRSRSNALLIMSLSLSPVRNDNGIDIESMSIRHWKHQIDHFWLGRYFFSITIITSFCSVLMI